MNNISEPAQLTQLTQLAQLALMAANGDNAAFEKLYEQTKGGVWFTCINLLKNEENAKDVMQETYITAFEKLGSLADFSGIQSWLNKIAANKCKNYIRTISNSHLAENGEELLENIPDDKLIPEEYVTDMAKRKIIMDIIKRSLSEEQYRTIILYYFDEMTAAEIAELMDCHEKTVLYRLKVARSKIKEEVMRYEEENKDKLHAVVFVPTLTRLFRIEAENTPVPNVPLEFRTPTNTQTGVPSDSAVSAAKQGGKPMLNTLKAKIIAGACAAVVVGGGVTAGVVISNNSKNKTESNPTYSASTNVSKPANASVPTEQSAPAASNATSGTASATTSGAMVEGDYEYMPMKHRGEVDDSAVMIVKYNGEGGNVKIPSTLGGKPVKSIDDAFFQCKTLTEVTIPEGVIYIESFAFSKCKELTKVNFPSSSLLEIGMKAFEDCEKLESVVVPDSVETIKNGAFQSCDNLKKVVIPDDLKGLGNDIIRFNGSKCEIYYRGTAYNEDAFPELKKIFDDRNSWF